MRKNKILDGILEGFPGKNGLESTAAVGRKFVLEGEGEEKFWTCSSELFFYLRANLHPDPIIIYCSGFFSKSQFSSFISHALKMYRLIYFYNQQLQLQNTRVTMRKNKILDGILEGFSGKNGLESTAAVGRNLFWRGRGRRNFGHPLQNYFLFKSKPSSRPYHHLLFWLFQ